MGSISFDGIRFQVYSRDHPPPHVHATYGSTLAVIEFKDPMNIVIRPGSVQPPNAKQSDLRRIVNAASAHYPDLKRIWEATHGQIG